MKLKKRTKLIYCVTLIIPIINLFWMWCDQGGNGIKGKEFLQLFVMVFGFLAFIYCAYNLIKKKDRSNISYVTILSVIYLLSSVRACNSPTPSSYGYSCSEDPGVILKWKFKVYENRNHELNKIYKDMSVKK